MNPWSPSENPVRATILAALLAPCLLLAQERAEDLERLSLRHEDPRTATDLRSAFLLGMTQTANSQTKQDLASSGRGAAIGWELEVAFHNHLVLGSHVGGLWLRERSVDTSAFLPGSNVSQQMKGFQLGAVGEYFITDADARTGPYLVGVAQWTRWKKYLGLDWQGYNIGDGEAEDKTAFTPAVGLGWHLTRVVALDVRYTRSRYREEYSYVPGLSKDWNLDHLTFSLVLRAGGKQK
jgi:hypothetical protein